MEAKLNKKNGMVTITLTQQEASMLHDGLYEAAKLRSPEKAGISVLAHVLRSKIRKLVLQYTDIEFHRSH